MTRPRLCLSQNGRHGVEEHVIGKVEVREMKGHGMGRVIHIGLASLRIKTAGASDSKPDP